jgi:hypothetical protein
VDIDREALAWAAGFFEGEGTVWHRKDGAVSMQVAINNTDLERLRLFRDIVGVGVIRPRPGSAVSVKPQWVWRVVNQEHVQYVAAILWGWLSPRRRQQFHGALFRWKYEPRKLRRHRGRVGLYAPRPAMF